jgi:hypothetical protein
MSIPVISTTTSILGYNQYQSWQYQPYATNNPISWACPNLPAGLSIDTPTIYGLTGVASTDVLTATGSSYSNGDKVFIPSLTGGAGLSANTIYFVRDVSGATFKLSATLGGAAIDVTTDLTAGNISKVGTGLISGAATVAGVFNCGLTATNGDGTSDVLMLTIGIAAASASTALLTNSGYQATIDVATKIVTIGTATVAAAATSSPALTVESDPSTSPALRPAPILFARQNDSLLLWITFVKGGIPLALTVTALEIALKELESGTRIILGNTMTTIGSGVGAYFGLFCDLSTAAGLADLLANYQGDDGTSFDALAEIAWTETNTEYGTFGPASFQFSTQDFGIQLAADMAS